MEEGAEVVISNESVGHRLILFFDLRTKKVENFKRNFVFEEELNKTVPAL